jgi:hypothetical protein
MPKGVGQRILFQAERTTDDRLAGRFGRRGHFVAATRAADDGHKAFLAVLRLNFSSRLSV